MIKILANDGIDDNGKRLLESAGFSVHTEKIPQNELVEKIKDYDAIIVRSATKITQEIIDNGEKLKVIGRAGVGLDNIDVRHAASKNIAVINTPDASSISVAELVFAHFFDMSRFLFDANRQMPINGNQQFNELKKKYANGTELRGKTLGIFGFGKIGQEIAKIAIGIGMKVMAFDIVQKEIELELAIHPELNTSYTVKLKTVTKDEVLQNADFITINTPFKKGNQPVLSKAEMNTMKNGVGLVNCARGGAINEEDILDLLDTGKLAYAGLDVFNEEPTNNLKLLLHPKVSLTPHIGGSTIEAQERIGIELAEKIIAFLKK